MFLIIFIFLLWISFGFLSLEIMNIDNPLHIIIAGGFISFYITLIYKMFEKYNKEKERKKEKRKLIIEQTPWWKLKEFGGNV